MAEVGRSFDKLDSKIKQLNGNLQKTKDELKAVDKSLKLNPGNVEQVRKKYALLAQNLQTNTEKLATLKEKQAALKEEYDKGTVSENSYNKQLQKIKEQTAATEKQIEQLTAAVRGQNAAISQARFTNFINGLDKIDAHAKKLSMTVLALTAGFAALMKSAIDTGDALYDNATHYSTSVEQLQIWKNRLGMLGKDQDAYTSSLEKVGSIMTSITAGRGARYLTFLKQLGITQADLEGKSNGEVFDMIYASLRNVTDETQRATIAQGIFGDTGLEIANIAGTSQEALDALDKTLLENGIITTEQAAAADEAANKLLAVKQQASAMSAEFLVNAMPTVEAFTDFLKNFVLPALNDIAGWFKDMSPAQQKTLLILISLLILLPKLIALGKGIVLLMGLLKTATRAQAAAQLGLNAAMAPWLIAILALTVGIPVLISLMGAFTKATDDAAGSASDFSDELGRIDETIAGMGADMQYNAESSYYTNTQRDLNIHVDVKASGDGTAINQDNADLIGESIHNKILRDICNQELGAVVR